MQPAETEPSVHYQTESLQDIAEEKSTGMEVNQAKAKGMEKTSPKLMAAAAAAANAEAVAIRAAKAAVMAAREAEERQAVLEALTKKELSSHSGTNESETDFRVGGKTVERPSRGSGAGKLVDPSENTSGDASTKFERVRTSGGEGSGDGEAKKAAAVAKRTPSRVTRTDGSQQETEAEEVLGGSGKHGRTMFGGSSSPSPAGPGVEEERKGKSQ